MLHGHIQIPQGLHGLSGCEFLVDFHQLDHEMAHEMSYMPEGLPEWKR
jgi:hypothetical protein